jgi:hypothetical protein
MQTIEASPAALKSVLTGRLHPLTVNVTDAELSHLESWREVDPGSDELTPAGVLGALIEIWADPAGREEEIQNLIVTKALTRQLRHSRRPEPPNVQQVTQPEREELTPFTIRLTPKEVKYLKWLQGYFTSGDRECAVSIESLIEAEISQLSDDDFNTENSAYLVADAMTRQIRHA